MIDRKLLAEQPEVVGEMLLRRGSSLGDVLAQSGLSDLDFAQLSRQRSEAITRRDALRHRQNTAGPEIARLRRDGGDASALVAEMGGVAEQVKLLEDRLAEIELTYSRVLPYLPNLVDPAVPSGGAAANQELRREGDLPRFDFEPKAHWDLGAQLGILDFERAAKLSGARFAVYWDAGARLERALLQFMLDLHTGRAAGPPRPAGHVYREVIPPYLVTAETLSGTGQLPKFEADLFKTRAGDRDLYLIPTAEVPLTNLHRDEILEAATLPRRYVAATPCFRSEAGSYGKDVRGLIRQHQFHKVELVKFAAPESSMLELDGMLADAEEVLKRLRLPYRVVLLASGDMGFASAKTYDLEVFLPGQQAYREISSCSNCSDFQARRAGIRYRPEPKAKPRLLHTLNGSGLAVGRTLVAIVENYQRADGSVTIPDALRPYMGGDSEIRSRS